jgi:predicted dehydrogenase
MPAFPDPLELLHRRDVEIVHIATPPRSHHGLVMEALRARKHVLCEKPLALRVAQADEMLEAARKAGVICPVNFVLRHNAVTEAVKAVLDSRALGGALAARLTNCAADSKLGPDHWFWEKDASGGIFVEHGVHFFDLYAYWLGRGSILDAHAETRGHSDQEDRVTCTIRFDSGALASHYHGFDQVVLMDRTDHRLVCELGDIRVEGWIPLRLTIDAVADDRTQAALAAACPGAEVQVMRSYEGEEGRVLGRGVERRVQRRIRLIYEPARGKQAVYAQSLRALLADQIAYIRDAAHPRVITESNGREALALAQAAAKLAAQPH